MTPQTSWVFWVDVPYRPEYGAVLAKNGSLRILCGGGGGGGAGGLGMFGQSLISPMEQGEQGEQGD